MENTTSLYHLFFFNVLQNPKLLYALNVILPFQMYKMTHKTGHLKIAFAFSLNVIAINCNVHPLTPSSCVMSFLAQM